MRKLRAFYDDDAERALYKHPYDHKKWHEHVARVAATVDITQRLIDQLGHVTVADLSMGDGAITKALTNVTIQHARDGDIEHDVLEIDPVDLFICTETIEHLRAPWTVLEAIARKTKWLVLSTPLDESPEDGNWEHYWSFTEDDVATLLWQSGFRGNRVLFLIKQEGWVYTYQLWTAEVADA